MKIEWNPIKWNWKTKCVALVLVILVHFAPWAKADDYNNTVVGHVITQVIQGVDVDHTELLEAELERIAYKVALEMSTALEKHLPYILEALAKELRDNADLAYKCKLLEDSTYKCQ